MNKLLLILALALPAFGVTASPTSISVYVRAAVTSTYGAYGTTIPNATEVTISGTGDWNIVRETTGDLDDGCGWGWGYCVNLVTTVDNTCDGALPTGNGAGTVWLCWSNMGAFRLSVGTHTGAFTIGSTTINVTLEVYAADPYLTFDYRSGFPVGCSNSSLVNYPFGNDTCTIASELPPGTPGTEVAVCDTYVDDAFGYTVKRITPKGRTTVYGALSAFSLNDTYISAVNAIDGQMSVYDVATCTPTAVPGAASTTNWSPSVDDQFYVIGGSTVLLYDLDDLMNPTTLADYSMSSGGRPALTALDSGGTTDITSDGWFALNDSTAGVVCVINLNGLTTGNQESKIFCADSSSMTSVDFVQTTEIDATSGDRYVVILGEPDILNFAIDGASPTALVESSIIPSGASGSTPHSDVGQTSGGNQYLLRTTDIPDDGSSRYITKLLLNTGLEANQPVEGGGGMSFLYPGTKGSVSDTTDGHYGCAPTGDCVHSPYGNSGSIAVKQIAAVTAQNPCLVRTTSAHGLNTSDEIVIGGGEGMTGLNGIKTITVVDTDEFTTGSVCSGTYTANTANAVLHAATATDSPERQELHYISATGDVRRLAQHRAKTYDNGTALLSGYYQTPRASISRDGRFVAFNSNMGFVENGSVWIIDTQAVPTPTPVFQGGSVSGPGTVR